MYLKLVRKYNLNHYYFESFNCEQAIQHVLRVCRRWLCWNPLQIVFHLFLIFCSLGSGSSPSFSAEGNRRKYLPQNHLQTDRAQALKMLRETFGSNLADNETIFQNSWIVIRQWTVKIWAASIESSNLAGNALCKTYDMIRVPSSQSLECYQPAVVNSTWSKPYSKVY